MAKVTRAKGRGVGRTRGGRPATRRAQRPALRRRGRLSEAAQMVKALGAAYLMVGRGSKGARRAAAKAVRNLPGPKRAAARVALRKVRAKGVAPEVRKQAISTLKSLIGPQIRAMRKSYTASKPKGTRKRTISKIGRRVRPRKATQATQRIGISKRTTTKRTGKAGRQTRIASRFKRLRGQ